MKMKIALTLDGKVGYGKITQRVIVHYIILFYLFRVHIMIYYYYNIWVLRCNDKGCKIDI